ncbi:hypothetical protein [Dokdonella sp.]|uniref:hypothetical protein n=1 Tax=Dokdonella sp. TaxID=2291710 RepID=UPI003C3DAE53
MKITRKLLCASLLCMSAFAMAQGGPPPSVEQRVQGMTEHLGLTAEQQASVTTLLQDNMGSGKDREASRAAVDAGLMSILTEDQYVEFKAAQPNREGRPQGRGPGGKGGGADR